MAPAESDTSEDARAFLQSRVALFWKVVFVLGVLSIGVGLVNIIAAPGGEFVLNLFSTAQAGIFWFICRTGKRSVRFSRWMEAGGLLLNMIVAALMGRYLYAAISSDHTVLSAEGALMTDGFVSMMLVAGTSLLVALRAALIPSQPRRTLVVTALVGVPFVVLPALISVEPGGGLTLRTIGPIADLWLAPILALMWGFTTLMCVVISSVIYGLRAEVREARQLGQYVLERKLGEGGMGEVYLARHGMMRRPTAIKLLRADRAGATALRRFEREVRLTARLTHPHTITIFDYGRTGDGVFYYAMELLEGATLERIIALDGAQPAGRVTRILGMACGALSEAHGVGLIHRDIKPANIMLCTQGGELDVVKVLDFGLVKELEVDREVKLTGDNTVAGTPQYLAPESILAPDSVDARTDIYALGAVAYFLLTGTEVFDGKSVVEVCAQHLHEAPRPASASGVDVPADLEAVVLACLEKDPDDRPQSAAELRQRIEACVVDPWDAQNAEGWWREFGPDLEEAPAEVSSKTIAIDRSLRTPPER